jgi:hypothetical protein
MEIKHFYPDKGQRGFFHDVLIEVFGEAENEKEAFLSLPDHIKFIAYEWGLNDTEFRDAACRFFEANKI